MERHSLNRIEDNGLKDNNNIKNKNKVRELWNCKYSCSGGVYVGGFSWPQRSYTCSFCTREFKTAQALGGHMNVHRRDRARLRQSLSWVGQGPEPSPDPNCTSAFQSTRLPPFTHRYPSLLAPPLNCSSSLPASCVEMKTFMKEDKCKEEMVRLDLQIGLCRDSKEDLDLELRLGYS